MLCFTTTHINQMPPQIFHILHFSSRLEAHYFVINWIEVRAVQLPEVWKFYRFLTRYCTFGLETANNAQNVRVDTARGKDNDQNLSKMIM